MLIFECELAVQRAPTALWRAWTDVERWAEWDPHEEKAHLDGAFEAGSLGYAKPRGAPGGEFTIVEVDEPKRWVSRSPLPVGELRFTHTIERLDERSCELRLRAEGRGPFAHIVQLGWGRMMRADGPRTLHALDRRAGELEAGQA
jgi:uncharacterized protein YndB with AHSA1/START domain